MSVFAFDRVPSAVVVDAVNMFTNPRFRRSTSTVEVYRNLANRPVPVAVSDWTFAGGTGGTYTDSVVADPRFVGGTARKRVWATADTSGQTYVQSLNAAATDLVVGDTFFVSMRVESSGTDPVWGVAGVAGAPTVTVTTLPKIDHGDGTFTHRAIFAVTAVSTGALAPLLRAFGVLGAGAQIVAGDFLFMKSPVPHDFFYGGFSPDPDMTASWSGTVNNSPSVLSGQVPTGLSAVDCYAIKSSEFGGSVRVIPNGSSNGSYVWFSTPVEARAGNTVIVSAHLKASQTGSLNANARGLYTAVPIQSSVPAENMPGSTVLRASFEPLTSNYTLRLYNGASVGGGDVYFSMLGVFAGSFAGDVFAGDTTPHGDFTYRWAGAVDNSVSERCIQQYMPVVGGTNPFTVIQVDGLGSTVDTITVWRDDGGKWARVRGAIGVKVVGAWSGTDHECGFNRETAYRVEQFDAGGNSLGFLPSETVTLTSEKTWLHNPLAPLRGVAVGMTAEAFGVLDRPHDSELLYPRGRAYGVSVGRGRRGLQNVNLNLHTATLTDADKVQALLGDEQQPLPPHLVVRKGLAEGTARIPHTFQVHVPTITEIPIDVRFGGEFMRHELSATEAAPPTPKLSTPVLTRGDLSAYYATRAARSADNLTRVEASRRWNLAGHASI